MARNVNDLAYVVDMTRTQGWRFLRQEALKKVVNHEEAVKRLLFRTRTPVDPIEIEYDRGFWQGVMYVLDGLPNTMEAEFKRLLKEAEQ